MVDIYAVDATPPNITQMWHEKNRTAITCPMNDGYVCIKYSFTYNYAVLNTTYFCGKMIQDTSLAIQDGCYKQQVR